MWLNCASPHIFRYWASSKGEVAGAGQFKPGPVFSLRGRLVGALNGEVTDRTDVCSVSHVGLLRQRVTELSNFAELTLYALAVNPKQCTI